MAAIDIHIRQAIISRKQSGESLKDISASLSLSYRTVVNLWQKYKQTGEENLASNYSQCGLHQSQQFANIKPACLSLKQLHSSWGAPRIYVALVKLYPQQALPNIRTLQLWYKEAHLVKPRYTQNDASIGAAKAVHNIWQVDAKEQLTLLDGQRACYLTIVDDKSGACLDTLVFPLSPYQSSTYP
jgi:hypothetical protein